MSNTTTTLKQQNASDRIKTHLLEIFKKGCFVWDDRVERRAGAVAVSPEKNESQQRFFAYFDEEPDMEYGKFRSFGIFIDRLDKNGKWLDEGNVGFLIGVGGKIEHIGVTTNRKIFGYEPDKTKVLDGWLENFLASEYNERETRRMASEYTEVGREARIVRFGRLELNNGGLVFEESEVVGNAEAKG